MGCGPGDPPEPGALTGTGIPAVRPLAEPQVVHLIAPGIVKARCSPGMDFGRALWLSCNKLAARERIELLDQDGDNRERGSAFRPKFDAAGLVTAVVVDAEDREVLMVAHMDAEALAKTRETGIAHFHSRSRGRLWMKGETSGHLLRVVRLRVDCDQDAVLIEAEPAGPACHTGERTCFFRALEGGVLARVKT